MMAFQKYLNAHPKESATPSKTTQTRLKTLMQGYRSTLDGPLNAFIPELIATYPNARFLLTVRDSEEVWWPSFRDSVGIHFDKSWRYKLYRALISSVRFLRRMDDMVQEMDVRVKRDYGSVGPQYYTLHNQRVRDLVPEGQLLEYNVKEGWQPLCQFLGVDVPDIAFPKLNEGDSIKAIYAGQHMFGAFVWAIYFALGIVIAYIAYDPWAAIDKSRVLLSYLLGRP